MPRVKLIVAYDGTDYHGFVKQKSVITVQQVLEEAIAYILRTPVLIEGAGRTDAGVHAQGQCCIFDAETSIPVLSLLRAINSKLPKDVVIKEAEIVPESFHPRFSAKRKTYRYQILNSSIRNPFLERYAYFYPRSLNIEWMKKAAEYMVGEHDFKCFCAAGSTVLSTVRTIYDLQVFKAGDLITIDVCGNGFLYNMVRIITGTLVKAGEGKIAAGQVKDIIESKERALAGPTVPPQGLTMLNIVYEEN